MNRQQRLLNSRGMADMLMGVINREFARDSFGLGGSQVKGSNVKAVVFGFVGDQGQRGRLQGHQSHNFDIPELDRKLGKFTDQMLRFTA